MEFGMFHEFPSLPGRSDADAFQEAFEQVDAAEEWGLDAMWLAELHCAPERSVLSAPLGIAAAIAARTTRMKIGIAVQVLPLCHPLRVAEEAATVDQISRGRLIFGVGRSGFKRVYDAYGIPYSESRERFAETFEIILKAWSQPRFSHDGKWHSFKNVAAVPRPYQQPLPPIRIAASSDDTYARIGTRGYPIFIAVRHGSFDELVPLIQSYRDAWKAAGHPGKGEVYMRVPTYLAETDAVAQEEPRESVMAFMQLQADLLRDSGIPERMAIGERLRRVSYDEVLRDKVLMGAPDTVARRLKALEVQLGLDGILAELNCGGALPHPRVMNALELLCKEVMPAFH